MGRPKTSEPRDRQLNLCLTASEFEKLRQRAIAVGMRTAHFGRTLVLDEPRASSRKREPEAQTAHLIYSQLVRLGNNLNQLVRHLHRTGDPLPADLEPLLADIRQMLEKVPR